MFKPEPDTRYLMPVVFGPPPLPGETKFGEVHMISHSFLTEPEALEPFVPYHFRLAERARVTVAGRMMHDVDWLAGRSCFTVRVSIDVEARHGDEVLRGPYGLVVWENDPNPVIVGRELLGMSKLVAEIPPHERTETAAAFECLEYGTRLLRVDVTNVQPAPAADIEQMNARGDVSTLGWKYSPGPGGSVDADYPVRMISRPKVTAMWTGESTVTFDRPTWEQCPISSRIVAALAELPVVEPLPAVLTLGSGSLDRDASTRLD